MEKLRTRNLEAEKIALSKQILQLEDEQVFSRLRNAVRKTLQLAASTEANLPRLSDEEVGQRLREARQQATNGEVISVEAIDALAQQWRTA